MQKTIGAKIISYLNLTTNKNKNNIKNKFKGTFKKCRPKKLS